MNAETLRAAWAEAPSDLPLGQKLLKFLRLSIIRMDLKPGEALSEKEVAELLGVSRQPVREAFLRLSESGLIEIKPQRGSFVVRISQRAVYNARFIREAIEVVIVATAAGSGLRKSAIEELRDLISRQTFCIEGQLSDRFFMLDEEFHRTLALAVGNAGAWQVIEGIKAQLDRVRYLCPETTPIALLVDQHAAIVDGIEARDVGVSVAAMQTHLRAILKSLPGIVKLYPDAFSDVDLPLPPSVNLSITANIEAPDRTETSAA